MSFLGHDTDRLLKNSGSGFARESYFSAHNANGAKRPKNLRFFSGAHRSVIGKNILNSEKPLFQQPLRYSDLFALTLTQCL
jgi:hypothetical protein